MAGVMYIFTIVLSYTDTRPTVIICFLQLTICHTYVWGPVMTVAAEVVMLELGQIGS